MPRDALSPDTQATLLLCGHFAGHTTSGPDPVRALSPVEYNRLARRLLALGLRPADLLSREVLQKVVAPDVITPEVGAPEAVTPEVIALERLDGLLRRGAAMALALERWSQLAIGVLGRSDAAYPARLRGRLRAAAPPLLFVAGQTRLWGNAPRADASTGAVNDAGNEAVCVVGSRDTTASGLRFARALGAACAAEGLAVVCGDSLDLDCEREAIDGALAAGGNVIGILPRSLGKAVLTKRNRQALLRGTLVLASPFSPETPPSIEPAEFTKYLYAISLAAIVIDSRVEGITWSGAVENHTHGWVPAFVRMGDDTCAGNRELVRLGLTPITEETLALPGALRQHLARNQA